MVTLPWTRDPHLWAICNSHLSWYVDDESINFIKLLVTINYFSSFEHTALAGRNSAVVADSDQTFCSCTYGIVLKDITQNFSFSQRYEGVLLLCIIRLITGITTTEVMIFSNFCNHFVDIFGRQTGRHTLAFIGGWDREIKLSHIFD